MRIAFRAFSATLLGLLCGETAPQAQEPPPQTEPYFEQAEVHRVQVDVSVVDPGRRTQASVPGLPKDAFEIRLDGRPLPTPILDRVDFDPVCRPGPGLEPPGTVSPWVNPNGPILVLVDLNFLDIRSRHKVAQSLRDLADLVTRKPLRVKVLVFSDHVFALTPDFTSDPQDLRRAADLLGIAISKGPPLRNTSGEKALRQLAEVGRSSSFIDLASGETPPDPEALVPAYNLEIPLVFEDIKRLLQAPQKIPASKELALREIDPRPSLSALESVLLSHGAIRGRKALVLFSSSWFDLSEELWLTYVMNIQKAAQGGFSIWAVDASGWSSSVGGGHQSKLLDFLANATGGEMMRSAGRLGIAFERVDEQLSCYYLFSIPLPSPSSGEKHHNIDVSLNSQKYPHLWNYRVRMTSNLTLRDPLAERRRRRLAALMEPAAFRFPEIRLNASYPTGQNNLLVPIDINTLLADLTFLRDPGRNLYTGRVAWEGLATNDRGQTVCRLGDGIERQVNAESPPARFPPIYLDLHTTCQLPGPGHYEFRIVVQDLNSGEIGAARALLEVHSPSEKVASISAVRLSKSSGRDFLLDTAAVRSSEIPRDLSRQVFIPMSAGEPIVSQDRLSCRFVACGLPTPPRAMLFRSSDGKDPSQKSDPLAWLELQERGSQIGSQRACREYEAQILEGTLGLGSYAVGLILGTLEGQPLPSSGPFHLFGEIPFRVIPPAPPPDTLQSPSG